MKAGILKDIKKGEYRVIATPTEVATLKADGHEVYVQRQAGAAAGFADVPGTCSKSKKSVRTHCPNGIGDAEGARTLDLQRDRLAF